MAKKGSRVHYPSVSAAVKGLKKTLGEDMITKGFVRKATPMLPTGNLAFDIASGGGIPINRMTLEWGPEHCGKTLRAMNCIREFQRRYPKQPCVYLEPEGDLNHDWAQTLGVDVDELIHVVPETCEQTLDAANSFLDSRDCGLLVLDSLASMAGAAELEKNADEQTYGNAKMVNRFMRQIRVYLTRAERDGRQTTFLCINQPRMQTSGYGNPETLPCGKQQNFTANMRVRLRGKPEVDSDIHPTAYSLLQGEGTIIKARHRIVNPEFKYTMMLRPYKGLTPGQCNDFTPFKQYAQDLSLLSKGPKGKGWDLCDPRDGAVENFSTLVKMWDTVRADTERFDALVGAILKEKLG